MNFFTKVKGTTQSPPRVGISEVAWSWLGAFVGIALVGLLQGVFVDEFGQGLLIGSFGATAVLVYGAIRSPLAQPRNVLGGHIISALIGVMSYQLIGDIVWLAAALAVSTSIAVMHMTKTLHPPGGATALIAVIGGESVHKLGYFYAFIPVGVGAIILIIVAVVLNNFAKNRRYPEFWF
ncbi:HPP family protein [Desulfomicrobium norvegicum]|uniref:HPP family protein n=1 Tax=Desulfomicrobium norvegicum (strain DSM 1741 / NCIMB 8310) TaxID=52561 RepID=A0A8G2C4S8_DESNO|nr:HPP family protein [Desulfomicrobium norvegicum]SFM01880.1 HPP family protein [Desulfomicrobium norvegicum]